MAYTRGSKEDYDRWANVTGDDGWSWDKLIPYMRKVVQVSYSVRHLIFEHKNERFSPPSDHHNTTGQFNPAVHSFDGINGVSFEGFPVPIEPHIFAAVDQLEGYPFNLDMNFGFQLGIGTS